MKTFNMNVEISDQLNGKIALNTNFGINVDELTKNTLNMVPNGVFDAFSGTVSLSHDNTTNYSISNVSGNVFRLNHVSGLDPVFRTKRTHSGDNTSVLKILKFNSTGVLTHQAGTAFNFITGGFVVGDFIQIRGNEFDTSNQGIFKILLVEEAKVVYENFDAISETVTLSQASNINGFSSDGVQLSNSLAITSGFSATSLGKYSITQVTNEYIEFFSSDILPDEGPIPYSNGMIVISAGIKRLIYIVSDKDCEITVDGVVYKINKLIGTDGVSYRGQLLLTGEFNSIQAKNTSNASSIVEIVTAG